MLRLIVWKTRWGGGGVRLVLMRIFCGFAAMARDGEASEA